MLQEGKRLLQIWHEKIFRGLPFALSCFMLSLFQDSMLLKLIISLKICSDVLLVKSVSVLCIYASRASRISIHIICASRVSSWDLVFGLTLKTLISYLFIIHLSLIVNYQIWFKILFPVFLSFFFFSSFFSYGT